jgi:hypothetical protein
MFLQVKGRIVMRIERPSIMMIIMLLVVTTAMQCNRISLNASNMSQEGGKTVPGNAPVQGRVPQGKAEGRIQPFKLTGSNLKESVMAHPMPEIWLVFASTSGPAPNSSAERLSIRVELPQDAQPVLLTQWNKVLASKYKQEVEGLSDAESFKKEDIAIASATDTSQRELTKLSIDAPDGKRTISWEEANELVVFINRAVTNLIGEAKRT